MKVECSKGKYKGRQYYLGESNFQEPLYPGDEGKKGKYSKTHHKTNRCSTDTLVSSQLARILLISTAFVPSFAGIVFAWS